MGFENLQWRRKLVVDIVVKARECLLMNQTDRIKKFGSSSTIFMTVSEGRRGLERTLSHISTRVSTSAKGAVTEEDPSEEEGLGVWTVEVLAHNHEHCQMEQHESS